MIIFATTFKLKHDTNITKKHMKFRTIAAFAFGLLATAQLATAQVADSAKVEQVVKSPLTIAVCGDIMMGTTFPTVRLPENGGKNLFNDAGPVLKAADFAAGNHEGALCDGGTSTKGTGPNSYAFRTPTSFASNLTAAGFDYLGLANNHSNDFGKEGQISTEKSLDAEGIAYSGIAGRKEWAVVERDGVKYGLCAFGHNSHTLKHTAGFTKVKQILDTLKAQADIVIVSFHGGAEGADKIHLPEGPETCFGENRGDLRKFAHYCIDNGADVVYGHGPHVTRCVEVYKDRFIAYSLGNFCTPYGMNLNGVNGHAPVITVRVEQDGKFVDGQIHPYIQKYGLGPRADKTGTVINHIKSLSESDVPNSQAKVLSDGKITYK